MKKILSHSLLLFFAVFVIFLSCKKEKSCEGCVESNKPPIAVAGPDQIITLPTDSISLDGSASNDPDGTISEWLWTKISGPASFNVVSAATVKTIVRDLGTGVYQFELMVKDNVGLAGQDTVQIIVKDGSQPNRPPVANAGPDQTIVLPTNSVTLNGSGSSDPDNSITNYAWIKISGPPSYNIVNANAVQTHVNNLTQGLYLFELKVTDSGGLISRDTVSVSVVQIPTSTCEPLNRPVINAQLIPIGNLSIGRYQMATAFTGSKVFFAGGSSGQGLSSRVDIYDITSQTWSVTELSIPRWYLSAIAAGDMVFFAGGYSVGATSRVDIYNLTTQSWSTAELSQPRAYIKTAAIGNRVFFAGGSNGGNNSSRVDIYDISANTWSTASLSEAKIGITATVVGNKIYFAGGDTSNSGPTSTIIDIYDAVTDSWSTSTLNVPKAFHAAIFKNGKIYWAGGATYMNYQGGIGNEDLITCEVEIRDINTQVSSFTNLSFPKYCNEVFEKDNRIWFVSFYSGWQNWQHFDIYDLASDNWLVGVLPQPISCYTSIISANNTIYMAGGYVNGVASSQVWKLEF
jgi:hypothetical protein